MLVRLQEKDELLVTKDEEIRTKDANIETQKREMSSIKSRNQLLENELVEKEEQHNVRMFFAA